MSYQIASLDDIMFETNDSVAARKANIYRYGFKYQAFKVKADALSTHWFQQAAAFIDLHKPTLFIIPSALAYGGGGTKAIEPYTPLLCTMQAVKAQ